MTVAASPVLALDLGGTQLRTAMALSGGALVGRLSRPTPRLAADVVAAAVDQLQQSRQLALEAGIGDPIALGISAPGPLDPWTGQLIDPPNLDASLRDFPMTQALSERLGLPALLERDTQVAALAEGEFGAARGLTDYVYVTVSTGIGGAVVSDGRLLRGPDGNAGELGHLVIDINGPLCGCGAKGHLEAIASGTGIARAAREAGLGELSAVQVAAAEESGDPVAAQIMDRARAAFAAAAVSIVDIFNPQRLIVGGGIALGQGERLLAPARAAVLAHSFRRQAARVEIVAAGLGDDVGLIGALSLVRLARLGEDGVLTSRAPLADDGEHEH